MQTAYEVMWSQRFHYNTHVRNTQMAAKKGDVIVFNKEDWEGGKGGKRAPSGQYRAKLSPKSAIKPGQNGNVLNLGWVITGDKKGKKTKANGVVVYDNIAAHVVWKIAQVLRAIGVKKMPKKMTLKELLALIKKHGKEIRLNVGTHKYQGKPQNDIGMYLPLAVSKSEDDIDEDEDEDDSDDDESDDDEDEDDDEESDDDDSDDEDEEEDDEDDEDDEDEDEDEDEAPRRRGKTKARTKKPVAKKRAAKKAPARRGAKKGKRK